MKTCVAVIGADERITQEVSETAEDIGRRIAEKGCVLVCGGRGGVMEAACRGAKSAGGIVVGIIPSLDKREANPYVDIAITTGMGHTRNALVVSAADVVIAVNGRIGTLSEIGLALCNRKPVVAVRGTGGVAENIGKELKVMGIDHDVVLADPEEAVEVALSLIK